MYLGLITPYLEKVSAHSYIFGNFIISRRGDLVNLDVNICCGRTDVWKLSKAGVVIPEGQPSTGYLIQSSVSSPYVDQANTERTCTLTWSKNGYRYVVQQVTFAEHHRFGNETVGRIPATDESHPGASVQLSGCNE